MLRRSTRLCALALVLAAMLASTRGDVRAAPDQLGGLPRVMFWAWERPEDLRGLGTGTGVAYLAATYRLRGDANETALRHQPLRVDPDTPLVAVVRIETDSRDRPVLDQSRIEWLASRIAPLPTLLGVRAIQIDFDATQSEREFYRGLLLELRRRVASFPLSITALASWCAFDHWIDGLPVDEAVPMLFQMGPVNSPFIEDTAYGRLRARSCLGAVGVSTAEPTPALAGRRRVYVFNPKSWTPDAISRARQEINRWR